MGCNIIELNGIPGVGKTTICEYLEKELVTEKCKILNEKDIFQKNKKRYKIFQIINMKNMKINFWIFMLGIDISIKYKVIRKIIDAIKVIRYNNVLYKNYTCKNCDYILLSEGMIQFISTLLDETNYTNEKYLKKIFKEIQNKYKNNIIFINCTVNEKIAYERINMRNTIPNSIDLMDKKILPTFLEGRRNNIEFIRNINDKLNENVSIDTSESIEKNIKTIREKLLYKEN